MEEGKNITDNCLLMRRALMVLFLDQLAETSQITLLKVQAVILLSERVDRIVLFLDSYQEDMKVYTDSIKQK